MKSFFRLFAVIASIAQAVAVPFEPASERQILERLPKSLLAVREAPQSGSETNVIAISARAQEYVNAYRAEADPRYLGYAEALLKPWWSSDAAPIPILVLRATIKQSVHNFESALRDLDLVLSRDPQHAQAWLTRATILQVQGKLSDAKVACRALVNLAPRHISVACLASITSLNGEAKKSYDALNAALAQSGPIPQGEKLWMITILAEIAASIGDNVNAEGHYKTGLALNPSDTYLLGSYADHLLDQKRYQEVEHLLENSERVDSLLLRRAIARKELRSPEAGRDFQDLARRFEASRMRGDSSHAREESRFALVLQQNPKQALLLAETNWRHQREPADARIFLEAALAANDRLAAQPVIDWMNGTKIEDHRLRDLVRRLGV